MSSLADSLYSALRNGSNEFIFKFNLFLLRIWRFILKLKIADMILIVFVERYRKKLILPNIWSFVNRVSRFV